MRDLVLKKEILEKNIRAHKEVIVNEESEV